MRTGRRQFIQAAAALAASGRHVLGANDRIRIGIIGTGGRGQLLTDLFRRCPEAEVVAVCDVYEPRRAQAGRKVRRRRGNMATTAGSWMIGASMRS